MYLQANAYNMTVIRANELLGKLGLMRIKKTKNLKTLPLKPTTENHYYNDVPKNFTWTNKNNAHCPVGDIKNQGNCGSRWVRIPCLLTKTFHKLGNNFLRRFR